MSVKFTWDTWYENHADDAGIDINHYFGIKGNNMPDWYKNASLYWYGHKSITEYIAYRFNWIMKGKWPSKTIRGCPAYINLFNNSILLKNPYDFYIETKKDGTWTATNVGHNHLIGMSEHDDIHAPGFMKDDWMILKFNFQLALSPNKNVQFNYLDPTIFNKVDYRVSPGLVRLKKNTAANPNLTLFFPRKDAQYYLPKDSVLGIMQFDKPISGLKRGNLRSKSQARKFLTHSREDHSDFLIEDK
jgi:hypothetical protein